MITSCRRGKQRGVEDVGFREEYIPERPFGNRRQFDFPGTYSERTQYGYGSIYCHLYLGTDDLRHQGDSNARTHPNNRSSQRCHIVDAGRVYTSHVFWIMSSNS
jgi:hypothetical protein